LEGRLLVFEGLSLFSEVVLGGLEFTGKVFLSSVARLGSGFVGFDDNLEVIDVVGPLGDVSVQDEVVVGDGVLVGDKVLD
jgi:hypothetical protein